MKEDEERLARLRACRLYKTEEEIAHVIDNTIKENLDTIRRYSNGYHNRNKRQLGR